MTDHALRALERHALADPTDAAARDRLADARVRAGLGWHRESLRRASRALE